VERIVVKLHIAGPDLIVAECDDGAMFILSKTHKNTLYWTKIPDIPQSGE